MTPNPSAPPTTIGGCATLACIWEATAAKPGNVHRGADFEDMTYVDFLTSASIVGPTFERSEELGLGGTVLEAVRATKAGVGLNTNLGTLLLLAPLALAKGNVERASRLVAAASPNDTEQVYEAIRLAAPGGIGTVERGDIAAPPDVTLLEAMQLAAERDLIARQYTNEFAEVCGVAAEIERWLSYGAALQQAIIEAYLRLLARHGDSLVERKLGRATSKQLSDRAGMVLASDAMDGELGDQALADLDFWLRADGHQRNPGTSADLIAAALFVLLLQERISWPVEFYPRLSSD